MINHNTTPCIASISTPTTQPNEKVTIEVTKQLNAIEVSQSQNMDLMSNVSTPISSSTNSSVSEKTRVTSITPPGLIRIHNQTTSHYIIDKYCHPVSDTFTSSSEPCKFKRNCIVFKTKIIKVGDNLPNVSPTVFKNNSLPPKKCPYQLLDTRLVYCFNKLCKSSSNANCSKSFHFICYLHMTRLSKPPMETLALHTKKEVVLKNVKKGIDMVEIIETLKNDTSHLIFPVCGKRCYNTVSKSTTKKATGEPSDYTVTQSWDKDGNVEKNIKSSIDVLIHWITTEENATRYFGGLDTDGKTSPNRKESYHHHIRDLIKEENGMLLYI